MWLLLCRCYGNQSCSAAGSNWELEEKDGKERKKEIEKEGVFQLEWVVPIVMNTNCFGGVRGLPALKRHGLLLIFMLDAYIPDDSFQQSQRPLGSALPLRTSRLRRRF